MAVFDRNPLLIGTLSDALRQTPHGTGNVCPRTSSNHGPALRLSRLASLILCLLFLQGCGLIIDAVELVYPMATNQLDGICHRGQVHVGMAVEPFRPFVFPAVWTDEGARVTGLDAELVRAVSDALGVHCGTPIVPVLHLVRFRDLFLLLNEGQLDFFVSAVDSGVPSPERSGFAYSTPYFPDGGISGISKRPELVETIRTSLTGGADALSSAQILKNLTIAVQEGTAAHLYANAVVKSKRLIICDSLPAAFEYVDTSGTAPIDVILGAQPVLEFMVKTVRHDWHMLMRESGRPLMFTQAGYAVVMAEESYGLRWLMNDVIFQLGATGRLQAMRHRWIDEPYAYPRRASTEGLPFDVKKMPAHYAQGTCRESSPH